MRASISECSTTQAQECDEDRRPSRRYQEHYDDSEKESSGDLKVPWDEKNHCSHEQRDDQASKQSIEHTNAPGQIS